MSKDKEDVGVQPTEGQVRQFLLGMEPGAFAELVAEVASQRGVVNEVVIAALNTHTGRDGTVGLNMFGGRFTTERPQEELSGTKRQEYNVTPYARSFSGTTVIVSYTDASSGERYYLFGKKRNEEHLILPGGYFKPFPLKQFGGEAKDALHGDAKDKVEEAMLAGKETGIYVQAESQAVQADVNLDAGARRELEEETGIKFNGPAIELGTRSKHGVTNPEQAHTIVQDTLFDLGVCDSAPKVTPRSDLGKLVWVAESDIRVAHDVQPQAFARQPKASRFTTTVDGEAFLVRDDHGDALIKASRHLAEQSVGVRSVHQQQSDTAHRQEAFATDLGSLAIRHQLEVAKSRVATRERGGWTIDVMEGAGRGNIGI